MEWISVKDRLPDKNGDFLAYVPNEKDNTKERVETLYYMDINNWFKGDYYSRKVYGVTHWMPLPEPPKEPTNA